MRQHLFGFVVFVGILSTVLIGQTVYGDVANGEPALEFTLPDISGAPHSLSDYKGSYVVLEWFNYDCPFVRKHYDSANMQKLQEEYTQKGVVWLSLNSSAPGKQGNYSAEEMGRLSSERGVHATAILLDPAGTVGKLYGAQTTPHIFIIDPNGVLIYQGAIDDVPSTDIADVAKAKNYVRSTLDAAMAGAQIEVAVTKSYGCSVKY